LPMERGLPIVATTAGAQSLCESCDKLQVDNPMDPFAEDSPAKTKETTEPLLISNYNKYEFVEKVKTIWYDSETWKKYRKLSMVHSSEWFSQFEAAKILDTLIEELFYIDDHRFL